jgi:uncharacterized membrane protein YjfL (UPF0719 family)
VWISTHTLTTFPKKIMNTLLPLLAQTSAPADWHANSLGQALLYTAVFSLAGTLLAIIGYKIFDLCTPGNLHEEIVKNRNLAAAVLGASIILGVCIVVAAAIMG